MLDSFSSAVYALMALSSEDNFFSRHLQRKAGCFVPVYHLGNQSAEEWVGRDILEAAVRPVCATLQ